MCSAAGRPGHAPHQGIAPRPCGPFTACQAGSSWAAAEQACAGAHQPQPHLDVGRHLRTAGASRASARHSSKLPWSVSQARMPCCKYARSGCAWVTRMQMPGAKCRLCALRPLAHTSSLPSSQCRYCLLSGARASSASFRSSGTAGAWEVMWRQNKRTHVTVRVAVCTRTQCCRPIAWRRAGTQATEVAIHRQPFLQMTHRVHEPPLPSPHSQHAATGPTTLSKRHTPHHLARHSR